MLRLLTLILSLLLLGGCGQVGTVEVDPYVAPLQTDLTEEAEEPPSLTPQQSKAAEILSGMTAEEKVGQLFLARCPAENGAEQASRYALGGYILFARDFEGRTPDQAAQAIAQYQAASKIPMVISVDEEGGTVTRVSRFSQYRSTPFKSPSALYKEGGYRLIESDAAEKSRLLASLGINVNMGPVCDVTLESGSFMAKRSFGRGYEETAQYVSTVVSAMKGEGMGAVLKHYPGYGDVADSHTAATYDDRPLASFSQDAIPFQAGIRQGAGAVLVCHNIVSAMDGENPASLSPAVHERLRRELDFDGVIMTDDLYMDAIRSNYDVGESAVLAILAGNDMLCSTEYDIQIPAVIQAVEDGRISGETLDAAVTRVLLWKIELGIIN